MVQRIFQDFVTLFVVVNPIGAVPLFIAIAGTKGVVEQRRVARDAVLISAAILLVFALLGEPLLKALGVDLASFQIAGGLVLLIIALRMVLAEVRLVTAQEAAEWSQPAVFPLAMPFLAGPATLMAIVLLTDDNVYTVWQQAETSVVLLVVLAITYVCLIGASLLQRLLGNTGVNVISRILGLLLATLAVKAILTGLQAFKVA